MKKLDEAPRVVPQAARGRSRNKDAYYSLGVIAWKKWYPAYDSARVKLGMKPEDPGPIKDKKVKADLQGQVRRRDRRRHEESPKGSGDRPGIRRRDGLHEPADSRTRRPGWTTRTSTRRTSTSADGWLQKALDTKKIKAAKAAAAAHRWHHPGVSEVSSRHRLPNGRNGQRAQRPFRPFCMERLRARAGVTVRLCAIIVGKRCPPLKSRPPRSLHPLQAARTLSIAELEAKVRDDRPKEDLAPLRDAYRFATDRHEARSGIPASPTWSIPCSGPHPGRHAHGPGLPRDRAAARRGRRHQRHRRRGPQAEFRRRGGALRRRRHQAQQAGFLLRARTGRPRASARCCWPWWRTSASSWSSWPTACTTCARSASSAPSGASASPARPSRSTRPSRTAWAWAKSAASWRTWPSSYLEPEAYRGADHAKSNPAATPTRSFSHEIRTTVEAELRPRRHSGARRRPRQARLLRLPEAEAPEDRPGPGLRSAGPPHHHRFGEELLRRAGRHPQRVAPHSRPHQGLHRHPAAQSVPIAAHLRDGPATATPSKCRSAPRRCTASPKRASPRTGSTRRAASGPAADDQRIAWLRQLVEWQRDMQRSRRVHVHPEGGPVPGRGLHLHAARQGDRPAARRHAHRFRLRHPLRRRQHLRRRQGQRPHRAAQARRCATATSSRS